MADIYKQVFLKGYTENANREADFTLFESVGELYENNIQSTKGLFSRLQTARDRVSFYKTRAMADLANYLIDFESNIRRHGGKVLYAEDAESALEEIGRIVSQNAEKENCFVSNSDILREIGLNAYLKSKKIDYYQPDFQSLPYALLKENKEKVLEKLAKKYQIEAVEGGSKADLEKLVNLYKKQKIDKLFKGKTAITGADFLVADIGGVAMSDFNGYDTLLVSFCKRHIVVAGIDRIIPSLSDLDYFTSMFSTYSSGKLHAYNEMIITGVKSGIELDGSEELIVILVDNGRTSLLASSPQRSALNCIGCKACMALCPVFKFSNRMDNMPLKGPLNAVKDPICKGFEDNGYLAFACTLCGKCSEVCPAKIPLHELILHNRREAVRMESKSLSIENKHMKTLCKMLLKEKTLQSSKNRLVLRMKFRKKFGTQKEFPNFKQKSFRMLWKEKENN